MKAFMMRAMCVVTLCGIVLFTIVVLLQSPLLTLKP